LPDHHVREDLNDLRDRGRTITGLCSVAAPAAFGGRSLFAEDTVEPEVIVGEIGYGEAGSRLYPLPGLGPVMPHVLSLRTATYRYEIAVRYQGRPLAVGDDVSRPFLADLVADPNERYNVAGQPEYGEVENEFRSQARGHLRAIEEATHR
jgi:hypothetical protein